MRKTERILRERLKQAEQEVQELRRDLDQFHEHFIARFRWWIQLAGKQETPSVSWLIEDDAKWLRSFTWWSW